MLLNVETSIRFANLLDRHFQERDHAGEDFPYWFIPLRFGCFNFKVEYYRIYRISERFYLDRAVDEENELTISFDYVYAYNHPIYKKIPVEDDVIVTCQIYTPDLDDDEILIKLALGMSENPMFS